MFPIEKFPADVALYAEPAEGQSGTTLRSTRSRGSSREGLRFLDQIVRALVVVRALAVVHQYEIDPGLRLVHEGGRWRYPGVHARQQRLDFVDAVRRSLERSSIRLIIDSSR